MYLLRRGIFGHSTNFIRNGLTKKMSSTCGNQSKPVVTIISNSLEDSFTTSIAKLCPSASFARIEDTDISSELLQDVEILLGDPSVICKWINKLPKLKWMQSTMNGVEPMFVNLNDMPLPSFVLTRLGGVLGSIIAEYVVGHVIARERKFELSWKHKQTKTWGSRDEMTHRELSDVTIGILGFGENGQEIAKFCKSLRMTVNSIHRTVPAAKFSFADECFSVEDLPKCLKQCDYICSVLPSTPSTRGLLSGDVLESCKEKKTVLINVGRGDVISNDSILKALDNQWIGGAILDVFEEEPLPSESPLWTHPQVTITPHVAGLATSSQVIDVFLKNFERYNAGKSLKYVVDWKKEY